jgi:hypothetical protein
MELSWTEVRNNFKTPLWVVCRCLWLKFQRCKCASERFKQQRDEARREIVQKMPSSRSNKNNSPNCSIACERWSPKTDGSPRPRAACRTTRPWNYTGMAHA